MNFNNKNENSEICDLKSEIEVDFIFNNMDFIFNNNGCNLQFI
jgi:uncharacterized protein (DUF2164 family)